MPEVTEKMTTSLMDKFLIFLRVLFTHSENPTESDTLYGEHAARFILRLTSNVLTKVMTEKFQPVGNVAIFAKETSGGVTEFKYTFSTIGDEPYQKFNLAALFQSIEEAFGKWGTETWGDLTKMDTAPLERWGHLVE